jgi:hypothetical protein
MMTKLLFLDLDGVLNSTQWSEERPTRGLLPPESAQQAFEEERLDPVCIKRLQHLVHDTNASIVITSTWRRTMPVIEMISMFALYGFEGAPVIGATPQLPTSPGKKITRGTEVQEWLNVNAVVPMRYVCLDDDADYDPRQPLVQTDADIGLQDADIVACRVMLNDLQRSILKPI